MKTASLPRSVVDGESAAGETGGGAELAEGVFRRVGGDAVSCADAASIGLWAVTKTEETLNVKTMTSHIFGKSNPRRIARTGTRGTRVVGAAEADSTTGGTNGTTLGTSVLSLGPRSTGRGEGHTGKGRVEEQVRVRGRVSNDPAVILADGGRSLEVEATGSCAWKETKAGQTLSRQRTPVPQTKRTLQRLSDSCALVGVHENRVASVLHGGSDGERRRDRLSEDGSVVLGLDDWGHALAGARGVLLPASTASAGSIGLTSAVVSMGNVFSFKDA